MRVVVDANIGAAALVQPQGWSLRQVTLVSQTDLEAVLGDPLVVRAERIDPDDVTYLAASAQLLWTRDRRLLAELPGLAVLFLPPPDEPA